MHGSDDYHDIPGTYVFDAEQSRRGYHLNMFCMSLRHAENREAFKENEAGYLDRFPMTPAQREAVLKRQWNEMLKLGGNIYYTSKLAGTDGLTFQDLAAIMTGVSREEYRRMMVNGGRHLTTSPSGPHVSMISPRSKAHRETLAAWDGSGSRIP